MDFSRNRAGWILLAYRVVLILVAALALLVLWVGGRVRAKSLNKPSPMRAKSWSKPRPPPLRLPVVCKMMEWISNRHCKQALMH